MRQGAAAIGLVEWDEAVGAKSGSNGAVGTKAGSVSVPYGLLCHRASKRNAIENGTKTQLSKRKCDTDIFVSTATKKHCTVGKNKKLVATFVKKHDAIYEQIK